jgi:hypothetical protein
VALVSGKFEKCRNEVDPLKGEDSFKWYIQASEKSQLQNAWSQQYDPHFNILLIQTPDKLIT